MLIAYHCIMDIVVNFKISITFLILFFLINNNLYAHSGGLNGQGCHNNKKTGGYHCHRTPGWNSGEYPNRNLSSYKCRITIGNQYFEFDPANLTNTDLNFKDKSGNVNIICFRK